MDLLKLGSQARKTGLTPRSNVSKDKYDMEDIDEFFEDTTWSDSKRNIELLGEATDASLLSKLSALTEIAISKRKRLGLGKIRDVNKRNVRILPLTNPAIINFSESNEIKKKDTKQDYQDFGDVAQFDVDEEPPHDEDFGKQNPDDNDNEIDGGPSHVDLHQSGDNDHMVAHNSFEDLLSDEGGIGDELSSNLGHTDKEMTLSPIPLLSLKNNNDALNKQDAPRVPENTMGKVTDGKFTKSMALSLTTKRNRPRILESDEDEQVSADEGNDHASSFESDVLDSIESQFSQGTSFKATAAEGYQNSPLPSPPPEGLRRSKRTKIAPLAYWRNERIVYSRAQTSNNEPDSTLTSDIRKVPLQEIREVVHIPESVKKKTITRRGRPPKNVTTARGRNPKAEPEDYDYESDPEIEGSEWFKEKLIEAEVFDSEESRVKMVVAWTTDGGEFSNGQQELGNFKVATLFSSDSGKAGSGLIEFPIDGFKASQTTGDSLFNFYVTKGLVKVTISGQTFIVTRGCVVTIPKKNTYDFKNIGQSTARLYFVQSQLD